MKQKIFSLLSILYIMIYKTCAAGPVINSVAPDFAYNTASISLTVNGENFNSGDKIYVGANGPYIIGSSPTSNYTFGVYIYGNYAYLADYLSGIQIVDITDPSNPIKLGSVDTPDKANKIVVSGRYAYIADVSSLQIIDIFDPNKPAIVSSIDTHGYITDVFVQNKYAYLADWNGLQIIDISSPKNPFIAGFADTDSSKRLFVSENYAYVVNNSKKFDIIDISNPAAPAIIGKIDNIEIDVASPDIHVSGKYAYVAGYDVKIIDISDPKNPVLLDSIENTKDSNGIYVYGNYLYIATEQPSLDIFDIAIPAKPRIVGRIPLPPRGQDVFVRNNYAYVANWENGLQIVCNVNKSSIMGLTDTKTPSGIYIFNNYLCLANDPTGVEIIDISNPVYPIIKSSVETYDKIENINFSNNYGYLTFRLYPDDGIQGLKAINIDKPDNLIDFGNVIMPGKSHIEINYGDFGFIAKGESGVQGFYYSITSHQLITYLIDTPGYAYAIYQKVAMDYTIDNYLYVADGTYGIQVINNENSIEYSLSTSGEALDLFALDNYLYVATGATGMDIIDISDSNKNLKIVSSMATPGRASSINVSGNYAYIADGSSGLVIANISNPNSPYIVNTIPTPANANAYGINMSTNYIYLEYGEKSIQLVDITNPESASVLNNITNLNYSDYTDTIDNYKYIIDSKNKKLLFTDIADKNNPIEISSLYTFNTPSYIHLTNKYIYTANEWPGLQIIDRASAMTLCESIEYLDKNNLKCIIPKGLNPDKYKVVAINSANETNTLIDGITILDKTINTLPSVSLSTDISSGQAPLLVNFTANAIDPDGSIVNYKWDFDGDNKYDSSTVINKIKYIYKNSRTYYPKITVIDNFGDSTQAYTYISVLKGENQAPDVNLKAVPASGDAPLSVDFSAEASDPDGTILSYEWDFDGDDTYDTTTTTNIIQHIYTKDGIYNAKVKVTDDSLVNAYDITMINVYIPGTNQNHQPIINLTAIPVSGSAPLSVDFTAIASDSDGNIVSYEWDFDGDDIYDTATTINTVSYTYKSQGNYNAKAKAIDNSMGYAYDIIVINVYSSGNNQNLLPEVTLKADPMEGTAPLEVNFTASATDPDGKIVKYEWDFDGNKKYDTITKNNKISYTYTNSGTYKARVRVVDNNGDNAFDEIKITINNSESNNNKKKKKPCFITNILRHTKIDKGINYLNKFRDEILLSNKLFKNLTELYYRIK